MLPTLDEVQADFDATPDPRDRLRLLVELGAELPPFPDALRTDANLVRGCQSQVWLVARVDEPSSRLVLQADADAQIVRGLVALLLILYADRSPEEAAGIDAEGVFAGLDLSRQLTPGRQNGLHAMVARIRALARGYSKRLTL
jgi:cysteine desulfuration protein SufE